MSNNFDVIFNNIFEKNLWGDPDSRSGSGSNMESTRVIRVKIPELIDHYKIRTIVDAPCGDLFWIKTLFRKFNLKGIKYIGLDIVSNIVEQNKLEFHSSDFNFHEVDLTKGPIPCADLIISRDCLLHFSYKNILAILTNFKASGSKYLLVSTYTNATRENYDVAEFSIGGRALNLQRSPFKLKQPLQIIVEGCTEGNYEYTDKSLALWKLSQINLNKLRVAVKIISFKNMGIIYFNKGKRKSIKVKNGLIKVVKKILVNR